MFALGKIVTLATKICNVADLFVFGRVGIDIPAIEVRYEHMNIDAEAYSAGRALPTFVNFNINLVEVI